MKLVCFHDGKTLMHVVRRRSPRLQADMGTGHIPVVGCFLSNDEARSVLLFVAYVN